MNNLLITAFIIILMILQNSKKIVQYWKILFTNFTEELPHIKRGPQDHVATKFDTTIVLECETTKPVKAVKWLKNKKEIWPQRGKCSMNVEETIATLTIMHFELSDCAEYTAVLRDDEESAPAKVELKVPPAIKLSKSLPNNRLKLHCCTDLDIEFDYEGFPEVNIKATINDKPINKMRSRMHAYNNKLSLRLKNVVQEDSGTLKIIVENEIGSASEEIQLYVINVPSKPLHLTAFNITSRSVMLKWEKAEDNGSPITNYIIERRVSDSKRWRNFGKCASEQYEFLVEDLYPNESYSFRIAAVNEVGEGAPSNVVEVVTISESTELEKTRKLLAPSCLKGTLIKDSKIVLITWKKVEEAEEYIVERSKLENDWEQIGITAESKFEDSFESSRIKYRVVARKGDHLSSPSEETEVIMDQKKEVKQPKIQETPRMVEKQQEIVEQKTEKPDNQGKQEKGKKLAKEKKEGEQQKKAEVVKNSEGNSEEQEIKAKKKQKIETGKKIEDELKVSGKVFEEIEEKVGSKKSVKKRTRETGKKAVKKEGIEVTRNFEEGKVRAEKESEVESDKEKIESLEQVEDKKAETLKEKRLEKKLEEKVEQKAELSEAVEVELEKDSEKKESAEVKQEGGKSVKKKKAVSKQRPKETAEQKLEGSISHEVLSNELITEKMKERKAEETAKRTEKLEVKSINDSMMVSYGTKGFELSTSITGNFDECFWTKDEKAVDKKLVKNTANTSILRFENVDESTAGLYRCTAVNKTEKATAEICVIVTGYPLV